MVIYNYTYKDTPVPSVGKEYHFFDDGKISESRHFIAKVEEILTKEDAKKLTFIKTDYYDREYETTLYDIWRREVLEHNWLFTEDTDFIVKCSIPEYDKDPIYFVRTKDGGWFSLDVTSWWQGGRLDVDGTRYESFLKLRDEMVQV